MKLNKTYILAGVAVALAAFAWHKFRPEKGCTCGGAK